MKTTKTIIEKAKQKYSNFCENKAIAYGTTLVSYGTMMATTLLAHADAASTLMETFIDILCKIVLVLGAVFVIMGITHYAAANSEGDGPAKNKATMQIASGVILAVLSVVFNSNKSSFVSIITE